MASTRAVDVITGPPGAAAEPMVAMRGITKAFPNVVANDQVDLDIRPGEVGAAAVELLLRRVKNPNANTRRALVMPRLRLYGGDERAARAGGANTG